MPKRKKDVVEKDSDKKAVTKKPVKKRKTSKKKEEEPNLNIEKISKIKIDKSAYLFLALTHVVFSPLGLNTPCETIGIDIGYKNLGISGLFKREGHKSPFTSWFSLISFNIKKPPHETMDQIVRLLYTSKNYEWFRKATCYRIELQHQINPTARAVALGIRMICDCLCLDRKIPVDVEYVHGELKYWVAPIYSEHARNNPLRLNGYSGKENTAVRKQLSIEDVDDIMEYNNEESSRDFLKSILNIIKKTDDLTDANLIARSKYEKIKMTRKKKDKKPTKEDPISEDDDNNNNTVFISEDEEEIIDLVGSSKYTSKRNC